MKIKIWRISQSLCIVLLVLTCGTLSVQSEKGRVRNIVLVHGAWADGSGWEGVYDILTEKGFNVTTVPNPNTSLADDVRITKAVLSLQDGPTVLVGHTY